MTKKKKTQEEHVASLGERMLVWFEWESVTPKLKQDIARIFGDAATSLCENVAAGPERTVALRKLLEGRDAAFRALEEAKK